MTTVGLFLNQGLSFKGDLIFVVDEKNLVNLFGRQGRC